MPDMLHLQFLKVVEVDDSDPRIYHILVEPTQPPHHCPSCGSLGNVFYKFARKKQTQVYLDTPMHGRQVYLYIYKQRWRCKDCGAAFWERLPEMHHRYWMTQRCADYMGKLSLDMPFTRVSQYLGVDEKVVRKVFDEWVDDLDRNYTPPTPRWMGLDEIHLIGKARFVVVDVEHGTLVDILETRNKDSITPYLARMEGREFVEIVAMDMWPAYRTAAYACFPNCQVVVDKFHVVKIATYCMDLVRKGLKGKLPTKKAERGLKRSRFLLLARAYRLREMQKIHLDSWLLNVPALQAAYEAKEAFFRIYDEAETRAQAEAMYDAWEASLSDATRKVFGDLIRAVGNWRKEIFNYWDCHRVTNAPTESMNKLIREMDQMGRGYSFKVIRAKMLYNQAAMRTGPEPVWRRKADTKAFASLLASVSGHEKPEIETGYTPLGADIATLIDLLKQGKL